MATGEAKVQTFQKTLDGGIITLCDIFACSQSSQLESTLFYISCLAVEVTWSIRGVDVHLYKHISLLITYYGATQHYKHIRLTIRVYGRVVGWRCLIVILIEQFFLQPYIHSFYLRTILLFLQTFCIYMCSNSEEFTYIKKYDSTSQLGMGQV